jgi:hypothetical protein
MFFFLVSQPGAGLMNVVLVVLAGLAIISSSSAYIRQHYCHTTPRRVSNTDVSQEMKYFQNDLNISCT